MGAKALEGLDAIENLPLPEAPESGAADTGVSAVPETAAGLTEKSESKLVEEAEKLTGEKKGRPGEMYDDMKEKRRQMLTLLGHYAMGGEG